MEEKDKLKIISEVYFLLLLLLLLLFKKIN